MKEQLETIEDKLDDLIALCTALDRENQSLRKRENNWQKERRKLLMKNETAQTKVEAMISRLKAMEQAE